MFEVQKISVGAASTMHGNFKTHYEGFTTNSISALADSMQIKEALESLQSVGKVSVERKENGFGFCWNVSFLENVGDFPLIKLESLKIRGSSLS